MAHMNTLRVTDEFDDTLDVAPAPKADVDDKPALSLKVNGSTEYAILLTVDDALALAGWLADWVESTSKISAGS